jgi:radical SAM superfamily enzyme YgiQ (UPF0313 family)
VLFHPRNLLAYNNYPNLGLVVVGSTLEAKGYRVKIVSEVVNPKTFKDELIEEGKNALLIGITALTTEVPSAVTTAQFIRKELPHVPILWGGWHATLLPDQVAASGLADFVIVGEGDEAAVDLADHLSGKQNPLSAFQVPADRIIWAPKANVEKLPLPNYDLMPGIEQFISGYLTDKATELYADLRWLPYESSRGCPEECTFCEIQSTENWKFRAKSHEKTVDEIVTIVKKYNLKHMKIIDDNMPVSIARMRRIAEGIVKSDVKFTYDMEVRANYFREDRLMNHEFVELLKASGLIQCTLGFESGSQRMLDLMKKGLKVEDCERAVKILDQHGIIARTSFITGYLGETKEDLYATARLIKRLRKYKTFTCGVQSFRPYPRTPVTEQLKQNKLFYEPQTLLEWTQPDNIAMFTYAELDRQWQPNYKLAGAISFYQSIESGVRLGKHMLKKRSHRFFYRLFAILATLRNRTFCYGFQFDRMLYHRFHSYFFRVYQVEHTD